MATKTIKPCRKILDTATTKMTCAFKGYSGHKGVDLIPKSTSETPLVFAFEGGKVIATGNVNGVVSDGTIKDCGTYVAIQTDDCVIRYQHLKYNSLKVKKGDTVERGQPIAYYGRPTSGNSSGCHLHMDISFTTKKSSNCIAGVFYGKSRYYVDPLPYIQGEKTIFDIEPTHKVKANLNIRKGAGTTYAVIGELAKGTKVIVYGTDNGWSKISKLDSQWVSSNYLTKL